MDLTDLFNIVIKFGSIAIMIVYVIFAFVVVRQIKLMVQTFSTAFDSKLTMLSWIHLGVAILVLILAFVI